MPGRGRPRAFDTDKALRRAMFEFWERGYSSVSMSQLTRSMQLNATSIYAAYGPKEELFFKAVDLYRREEGARVWAAVLSAESPKQVVEALLRTSAEEFSRPHQPKGCLIIMGAVLPCTENDSVHLRLKQLRRENEDILVRRLEETAVNCAAARTDGWCSVARFYLTVQQGMSLQAKDGADPPYLAEVAENAVAAWETLML